MRKWSLAKLGLVIPLTLTFATSHGVGREAFGPGTSGGGGAFVCRDHDKNVQSVELVDLWEARAVDGLKIIPSDAPYKVQAAVGIEKLNRLDPFLAQRTRENLKVVSEILTPIGDGIQLAPPVDLRNGYMKPGCPAEGMLYYDGIRQKVAVDRKLFDLLPNETERAAGLVHEAVYKSLREIKGRDVHTDSVATRQLVGCLLSEDDGCLGVRKPAEFLPTDGELLHCRTSDGQFEFSYWPMPGVIDGANFLFTKVFGEKLENAAVALNQTNYAQQVLRVSYQVSGFEKYFIKARTIDFVGFLPAAMGGEYLPADGGFGSSPDQGWLETSIAEHLLRNQISIRRPSHAFLQAPDAREPSLQVACTKIR